LRFKRHGAFTVIPNAIDDYTLSMPPLVDPTGTVHWRGGASHQEDLFFFRDIFHDINPPVFYHGWDPWFLNVSPDHVFPYIPDYYRYMALLAESHPTAVIVPLMDCPFNRCKSNIAALEAIWAGAIPVVPDWPEWQFPGSVNYQFADLARSTNRALELTAGREVLNEQSKQWLLKNRVLSVVNPFRVKIIRELMEGGK
jgi:hypothetical protein